MIVFETLHGLISCGLQFLVELSFIIYNSHSFASTTERSLHHYRVSNFTSLYFKMSVVVLFTVIARHNRHSCSLHNTFRFSFRTHRSDSR
jgi:hypothetical protein